MELYVKKWTEDSTLPTMAHQGDAGIDCFIRCFKKPVLDKISGDKNLIEVKSDTYTLKPLERVGCPLGFATAIPEGFYAAVVPRSGNALWKGLSIVNTPGTIDAGYRNEWMAIIINLSNDEVELSKGEKICQFILRKLEEFKIVEVKSLEDSERGLGGFGSSGMKLNKKAKKS